MTYYRNVYEFDDGNQSLGAWWSTREKAIHAITTSFYQKLPHRRVGLLVVKERPKYHSGGFISDESPVTRFGESCSD